MSVSVMTRAAPLMVSAGWAWWKGSEKKQELVIYSDFLHNTKKFSMYRTINNFDNFAATDYGLQAMPKLREVSVHLKYLMHTPNFQGQDNKKFWMQLFKQSGAATGYRVQLLGFTAGSYIAVAVSVTYLANTSL